VPARVLSAREVAALTGGELIGSPDATVAGVAALDEAGPSDVSFLASGAYLPYFQSTRAGLVLVAPGFRDVEPGPAARVVVTDPRAAMRLVAERLAPEPAPEWGIAPTARLGRGCRWQGRIFVGPGAVLGAGVTLGTDCRVGPHAQIGDGTVLGDRVTVKAGARVGLDGFAFTASPAGPVRVPHRGGCRIGDDVEIGANTTVDRGSVGTTTIGAGTKLDNLVHVGHNVRIGARCLIMAQTGMAGAVVVGDDVAIAGQAGLADHLTVGDRARVAAQSGVIGDVPPGATVSGYPARDHRQMLRQAAALRRLTPWVAALEHLAQAHDHRE
jgi:UDP-3-O-[3-hydroxymyristoyl] glucosamine N-acyltransferase